MPPRTNPSQPKKSATKPPSTDSGSTSPGKVPASGGSAASIPPTSRSDTSNASTIQRSKGVNTSVSSTPEHSTAPSASDKARADAIPKRTVSRTPSSKNLQPDITSSASALLTVPRTYTGPTNPSTTPRSRAQSANSTRPNTPSSRVFNQSSTPPISAVPQTTAIDRPVPSTPERGTRTSVPNKMPPAAVSTRGMSAAPLASNRKSDVSSRTTASPAVPHTYTPPMSRATANPLPPIQSGHAPHPATPSSRLLAPTTASLARSRTPPSKGDSDGRAPPQSRKLTAVSTLGTPSRASPHPRTQAVVATLRTSDTRSSTPVRSSQARATVALPERKAASRNTLDARGKGKMAVANPSVANASKARSSLPDEPTSLQTQGNTANSLGVVTTRLPVKISGGETSVQMTQSGQPVQGVHVETTSGKDASFFTNAVGVDASHSIFENVGGNKISNVGNIYMKDQVDNDLSKTLPHANAAWDSIQRNSASGCFPGTRKALLSHIFSWVENSDPNVPSIFWLHGIAGIGKTTVAHSIAEKCAQKGILGASFFFSRDEAERSNVDLLVTTLAYQLAKHSLCGPSIIQSVKSNPDVVGSRLQTQLEELIVNPLCAMPQFPSVIIVVIDALDECSQQKHISQLLGFLATVIRKVPFQLKFLVTSRPEAEIRSIFNDPLMQSNSAQFYLHSIEDSIVQGDIEQYLAYHLPKIMKTFNSLPWPTKEDQKALAKKANKLFIYAATAIKFIADPNYDDPQGQLQSLLQAGAMSDLDALYLHVLQSALPSGASQGRKGVYQAVIGSIMLLFAPFNQLALERFVGVTHGSVATALARLHSIIIVPTSTKEVIHVMHASLPDYLMDENRCADPLYFIDKSKHHARLTFLCFNSMKSLKQNICNIDDTLKLNSEVENLERLIEAHIPLELQYSCCYWASHLFFAPFDENIVEALRSFCFTHILHWVETLSLIGRLNVAIPALRTAWEWCNQLPTNDSLNEVLNDAERLILEFNEPIRIGALQIYHSALPFCPKGIALVPHFADKLDRSVKIRSGGKIAWGACLRVMEGHSGWINTVAFSPDGSCIVSGSYDHTLRLWNARTGDSIATLEGHSGSVTTVAFSPDGSCIVSASDDDTLQLWNARTGDAITSFHGRSGVLSPPNHDHSVANATIVSDYTLEMIAPLRKSHLVQLHHCGKWVVAQMNDGWRRLFWMPQEYRGREYASHGTCIVIGSPNGKVTIIDCSPVFDMQS